MISKEHLPDTFRFVTITCNTSAVVTTIFDFKLGDMVIVLNFVGRVSLQAVG